MKHLAVWFGAALGISALAAGCSGRSPGAAPGAAAATVPALVAHVQDLPVTTGKRLAQLEARLMAMGFKACAFKDGPNISGHSLVGKHENVEFSFSIHRERSSPDGTDTISVSCEARAPSRREAEEVSRRLIARLTAPEEGGKSPAGEGRSSAQ